MWEYVVLVGSIGFFAALSAVIYHRSQKEAKKLQDKARGNSQSAFEFC